MKYPGRDEIKRLREKYPVGTRIRLIEMRDEPYPVSPGTLCTVKGIDDMGSILISWDNGRGLSLIPGVDKFEVYTAQ